MTRIISTAFAVAFVVGLTVQSSHGQCVFERTDKAKKFQAELTQAMRLCGALPGGAIPNATSEDGIPACAPPTTFNQLLGSPVDGWRWGEDASGKVLLKAEKKDRSGLGLDGDTATDGGADNPEDIGDVQLKLKLSDVVDLNGQLANGSGLLTIAVRTTFNDRLNGDLTLVDVAWSVPVALVNGKASLKSSLNFARDLVGAAPLPRCASLEVASIQVLDPNGAVFAVPGIFIVPL